MYEFLLVLIIAILGLLSHVAQKNRQAEWALRIIIVVVNTCDTSLFLKSLSAADNPGVIAVLAITSLISFSLLFAQARECISWLLTLIQLTITGQILLPVIRKKLKARDYFRQKQIFSAHSFPHLISLFIYVNAVGVLLTKAKLEAAPIPFKLLDSYSIQQFLTYGGILFIVISLCGIGLYITRSFKDSLQRLSLIAPKKWQIGLALFLVFATFAYDAYWILYTHSPHRYDDLAMRLSYYNAATFTLVGSYFASIILALIISTFSAVGEEILFRGALQPVFGILPSALLQSLMLSQRHLAPLPILQMLIWCTFMGLVKRYTNTTTTIITHVLLNLITILLYVVNP